VLNLLSAIAAAAAVASAFAASAAALIGTSSWLAQAFLMASVLIAAGAINIRSVGGGARLVEIAVAAKLLPLVLFVVVGAAFVRPELLSWSSSPPLLSVMSASGVLIFAFMGEDQASVDEMAKAIESFDSIPPVRSTARASPAAGSRSW